MNIQFSDHISSYYESRKRHKNAAQLWDNVYDWESAQELFDDEA